MKNKLITQLMSVMFALLFFCALPMCADATQIEEVEEERAATELTFEIANFTYEILTDAKQSDMPTGFTVGNWEYKGVSLKAGTTENSDMICVMAEDWETGYEYRFIYDPAHDLFVPYFGYDIKDGYVYTIPVHEDVEVPYGFMESYFVIQTVPMFPYMRLDAELTQEEIAVGSLSEDNYLVFYMMNESGEEVYYTYDLIDRTFQRSLLQLKDAEKVTELNDVIDGLHTEIGKLNANHTARMNKRLTLIAILIALVVILIGVVVNLVLKLRGKDSDEEYDEDEAEDDGEYGEDDHHSVKHSKKSKVIMDDDDLEILDLDLEDE